MVRQSALRRDESASAILIKRFYCPAPHRGSSQDKFAPESAMADDLPLTSVSKVVKADHGFGADLEDSIVPAMMLSALRGLAAVARLSGRHEADVGSALSAAGLAFDDSQRDATLRHLAGKGWIERIVPLYDGGILLVVTPAGMSRAAKR